ncbi:MAG TPA: hypothetical protein VGR16_02590 [Thermomicrobiales bacterium]|nr:hypothetical protein [Thermomicrobiales bacterium]
MPRATDICRIDVVPRPRATVWANDQITEQRFFTDRQTFDAGQRGRPR